MSEWLDHDVFPKHFYVAAFVNLKGDAALGFAYFFVVNVGHRFAVEPCLDMVADYFQPQVVPFSFFKDIFFVVGNLIEPAAAVAFIYASCVVAFGGYFALPAMYFHGWLDK